MDDNTNPLRTTPSLPPRSGGVVGPWGAEDDYEGVLHALEIAGMGAPYSDVQGNLYCARQYSPDGYRDAEFRDYGLARAVRILCNNAARIRSTLADPILEAPADEEVERGWLIELKPSVARQPTWFHLDDEWTTDSTKALRFARKADAEAFIAHSGWTEAFASEHMWGLPASRAAFRRSTETDKPGVREAALEEAAKVAASFGDPVCNPFTFTRHAHAQEVATAIRALSASPAPEEQVTDVEADRRERALKVDPDKHGHRTRFSDSSYFDEVCIMCGATDGFGDKRLDQPCPKPLPRSTTGGAK